MGTVSNIKIEPMNVTWGADVAQVQTITCVADVSDSLDGKYGFIYTALNALKHHFWFNTSGGSAVDPNPGGSTAVEVAIATNATASAVATALAAALEALPGYTASANGAVVTVTNAASGYASAAHEGVGTGFSFAVSTEGDSAADIGYIDGDIEISMEEDLVDVTAHQKGTNVLSQIRTGKQVEMTVNFKETTVAQLKKLINQGGGSFTPAGPGGTEVSGWGTSKDFQQTLVNAKKLVLHPVVLGAGDKSRDITVHQAYAMLESLTFSGEEIFNVPVTFKAYPKDTLNDRVEYFAFGDGSQTLT